MNLLVIKKCLFKWFLNVFIEVFWTTSAGRSFQTDVIFIRKEILDYVDQKSIKVTKFPWLQFFYTVVFISYLIIT